MSAGGGVTGGPPGLPGVRQPLLPTRVLTRSLSYSPGDVVAVRYEGDMRTLHERLILHIIGENEVLAYTPDGDVYPLVLSTPPLAEVVPRPPGGRYTRSQAAQLYRLRDGGAGVPTLEEFRALQEDHLEAAKDAQIAQFGLDPRSVGRLVHQVWRDEADGLELAGGVLPLGACALGDLALYATAEGEVRVATTSTTRRSSGAAAPPAPDRTDLPLENTGDAGASSLKGLARAVESAAALGDSDTERLRRIGEALARSGAGDPVIQDTAAELGCIDGRFNHSAKPDEIVSKLKLMAGLDNQNTVGAADDGGDARTLTIVRGTDGMRRRNSRDAVCARAGSSWFDWPMESDPVEDMHLYLGLLRTRGLLMVSPAPGKYVGTELKDVFKAAEARRKAHEERQPRKPKK